MATSAARRCGRRSDPASSSVGTGAEVTPARAGDRVTIGPGKRDQASVV
jgi:hypothetical protein